jgi:hypothetical protein
LNICNVIRYAVRRQTLDEYVPVGLVLDAPIKHDQYTAVGSRPDEPAKSLLEGNGGLGNLIVEESAASAILDRLDAGHEDWIAGHAKRKAVDNHATQLLALYVDALPE